MSCVIVDCGSGNLHSARKALERAAGLADFPGKIHITQRAEDVLEADYIVLPGVGAFEKCRDGLLSLPGMVAALEERVLEGGYPFLGICVGMQLMATQGVEGGEPKGLDWIEGKVELIGQSENYQSFALKVPHMGWNDVQLKRAEHPLFQDIPQGTDFYFVHSYHFVAHKSDTVLASTEYGGNITAALARDNLAGVQFHPEKSQDRGIQLLRNFLLWRP